MKTQSTQDYIKTIYQILEEQNGLPVATSTLAGKLGITNASVTGMLKRLASAEPRLVDYEPYAGVTLTPDGEKAALEMIRHHRLIESYLSQALGYPWDEIHAEAERLEHVISEVLEERISNALGHPTADPHGDPIPDRYGNLPVPAYLPLTELPAGQHAVVRRVTGQTPELLRYLAEIGLVPSTPIQVTAIAPFNGPISLQVGENQARTLALGREIAEKILVVPDHVIEKVSHNG